MPFGLTNAPAVFQAMVNDVQHNLDKHTTVNNLDDILIFSKTFAEHQVHVREVLQRLLEKRLFVKGENHVTSVACSGYIVER